MRNPLDPAAPSPTEKREDMFLWVALLLSPFAMGINTIVGFIVAHWTNDTAQKRYSYLVSAIDFALCILAFLLSSHYSSRLHEIEDDIPIDGRRVFMAKLSMLLSVLSALLVIAGTIAVFTLHPTD